MELKIKSRDTVKTLRPADEIVQSLINLRDELYAGQDHRLSEALFKINSCLYRGYKVEKEPINPVLEPVEGDLLPPVGSRVYIRQARDNDAHACTVTGYYVWEDLLESPAWLHRVFVRMVYAGTQTPQTRILCECYPTEEAALAVNY